MAKSNEHVSLQRTGKSNLLFKGKELASSTTNPDGIKERWTEMKIFKTVSGSYVTQVLGLSKVEGEVTRSTVKITDTPDDIPNLLGFGDLAKQLYTKLLIMFNQRM